jgi:hypothetical protein
MKRTSNGEPRVRLDIGALQLHGFPEHAREGLIRALNSELERLIDERGVPSLASGQLQLDRLRIDCASSDHHAAGRDAARTMFGHVQTQAATER